MRVMSDEISHADILTRLVPGVMPQMVGILFSKKFHFTSFFEDGRSDFAYIHHQESTSADNTVIAKRAYEAQLRKYGKEARHCHANNGAQEVANHKEEI